jgi:Nuclease-related domain
VLLLHDRRVPRHGYANIDHIAVGAAGVLVIDTKSYRGKIRTDRVGGLVSPRRTVLLINGRDQTPLIGGVERQVGYVRDVLSGLNIDIAVRGALCFPNPDGLPLFNQLRVRGVVIDGPKPIAKLARRPGPLKADTIDNLWQILGTAFPES